MQHTHAGYHTAPSLHRHPVLKTNSSREDNGTVADPGNILDNPQLPYFELVFGLSSLVLIVLGVCSSVLFTKVMRRASTIIHDKLLHKVGAWAPGVATAGAAPAHCLDFMLLSSC